ncbi:hypothetical protein O3M35_010625 [Rhynocoris fuscipes]|uniref:C2H2-type domain-containing protein n=1 Tax=Rhynocoris fuscipes TaxID=488301 RepID=A0AAW1D3B4_9HEMI
MKHMLRCKSERILDPIKAVSDHLSERIILESNEESMPYFSHAKPSSQSTSIVKPYKLKQETESLIKANETSNMNNNLMFRSMFFMNDEPRHFLAPHIPVIPNEAEYFQRKQNTTTPGGSATTQTNVASQTANTGENSTTTPHVQKSSQGKQRPHTCEECGKSFLLKHHLATHIRVHTGERPHVCPECGKSFALKHCLSTHLLLHSAERPYKCNECNKNFTLKHHLVSHEKMHTRDRPFECRECGQRFSQKRHLSTHMKFHSGERPFSCQVCGETFTREEHLVMHSRFHGGLQPYICPDCGAGFLRKFQLVEHERQHGRCPDACPTCGKEFLQKRTLLLHVRSCGMNNNPHNTHNVDPNAALTKVCKECGEAFSSAEGLALHMRLHIGDHSFLSDICSLAASLKQAAGTQTPSIPKKAHSCPDCNRSFTQKHGLNQHMLRYPNGACKLKPFRCDKCGKSFSQKNHLVLHERQHMEPSARSELQKHRNNTMRDNSMASIENSQATLMRHLELSSPPPRGPHTMPHPQKPHLVLHERQMEPAERNEINKVRNNMESMENSQALMRHLEMSDPARTQQQHPLSLPGGKGHHVLHERQMETDRNDLNKHRSMEAIDGTQSSLMRHLDHPLAHNQ